MRELEPLARPALHHSSDLSPPLLDVVERRVAVLRARGPERGEGVEVAALFGLDDERRRAPPELTNLPEPEERPQGERLRGVDLPRDAGAPVAEDRLGLVTQLARDLPGAAEVAGVPAHEGGEGDRVRIAGALGELGGDREEGLGSLRRARSFGGKERPLHRDRAGDAIRLSRVEREEEVLRLKTGPPDHVDHREPVRGRPADVDPRELGLGDLRPVALREAEAAHPDPGAPPEESGERAARRLGELHPDRPENRAERVEPFVDVPAAQELLGGAALEIERQRRVRPGDGAEIRLRRLRPPPAVRERVPALLLEHATLARPLREELDRRAVEYGRAIEGEGVGRARGGERRILRGFRGVARPLPVHEERFRIGVLGRLERDREPRVAPPLRSDVEMREA